MNAAMPRSLSNNNRKNNAEETRKQKKKKKINNWVEIIDAIILVSGVAYVVNDGKKMALFYHLHANICDMYRFS